MADLSKILDGAGNDPERFVFAWVVVLLALITLAAVQPKLAVALAMLILLAVLLRAIGAAS